MSSSSEVIDSAGASGAPQAGKEPGLYTNPRYALLMTGLAEATLEALRVRVTRVLPMQVHAALETLSDEQIWWRPNEGSNSVGNLVLHLCGSLNHYLNHAIGSMPYSRDRDGEFAFRGPLPKSDLLSRFDEMVTNAEKTFAGLSSDRLAGPTADPERYTFLVEDLVNVTTHLATHVGQIVWIAKMLNEGSVHETWMRSHKHGGAWK